MSFLFYYYCTHSIGEKSKTDDIDSNQNTEEVEKDIKNNEAQSPNQSGIKRRACVRNLKLGGIQNTGNIYAGANLIM